MTASSVVLDTSAYAHFRAGHFGVIEHISKAAAIHIPVVVLGELFAGFRLGSRRRENEVVLAEFLRESFVSVLPVTQRVAECYGEIFSRLRRGGTPVPVNDIWIAATAMAAGAHLLTFDSNFKRIKQLELTVLGS